ncbi:uncharacterized protein TM35_000122130 [Trypanosoma theileri]|uniref:Leucyl/phenylalanyl-tRNA protein transferase n=1 Tax=Trypanosoma theileri TaxID=67003 RepID=A0A1X0NY04_9TRYP|nr:uncharacterized protein TM35_000122130 [Trypanosoma theileri]ORC89438.1 hypothetical protein TM35_000122130 [Trypanosoma theileri]
MLHTTKHFVTVNEGDTSAVDIDREVLDAASRDNVRTVLSIKPEGLRFLSEQFPLVQNFADLDTLPERLSSTYRESEYGCCLIFCPSMVDASCRRGIFPMAIKLTKNYFFFAPKLHGLRSLTQLQPPVKGFPMSSDEDEGKFLLSRLHVSKKFLRSRNEATRTISFDLFINRKEDLAPAFSLIRRQHGENWLCHALRLCFAHMFLNPDDYATKIVVVAIRRHRYCSDTENQDEGKSSWIHSRIDNGHVEEGDLIAAEIGFLVGDIYCSATGAYSVNGAGTLQLAVTGVAMQSVGCKVWDLGMGMKYKDDMLGCVAVPRKRWVQIVREHTSKSTVVEDIYRLLREKYSKGVPVLELLLTRESAKRQRVGEGIA